MTIAITITDGTNTVTLSGTDAYCESYQPQTPEVDAGEMTETLEVTFIGGNSAIDANLAKLGQLFAQARKRRARTRGIAAVYLKLSIDGTNWRSEIYDGKPISTPDWIKGELAQGTRRASVIVQHAPWWEKDDMAYVLISNGNGSAQQSLRIYNNNDGSGSSPTVRNNWVSIAAAAVLGELPAPAYLKLTNQNEGAFPIDTIWIANNVNSYPGSLVHYVEGETGSGDTADASCSNGNYHTFSGASIDVAKSIATMAYKLGGGYYRVLARMKSAADWKIKPYFRIGSAVFYGPTQTLGLSGFSNFYLWDLGIIGFNRPPGNNNYNTFDFGFLATKATSGSIDLDYLQLTALDGWRMVKVPPAYQVILDEIEQYIYSQDVSSNNVALGTLTGAPMAVYPGKDQKLMLLYGDSVGKTASITSYANISIQYRERRRSL